MPQGNYELDTSVNEKTGLEQEDIAQIKLSNKLLSPSWKTCHVLGDLGICFLGAYISSCIVFESSPWMYGHTSTCIPTIAWKQMFQNSLPRLNSRPKVHIQWLHMYSNINVCVYPLWRF